MVDLGVLTLYWFCLNHDTLPNHGILLNHDMLSNHGMLSYLDRECY